MWALWIDWTMMNRLRCTWTQLQREPVEEMAVFAAFVRGEATAKEILDRKGVTSGGR